MEGSSSIDSVAITRLSSWGGNTLLEKMINLFMEHTPERMESIRKGVSGGEAAEVEQAAHSLKSSAGTLGAMELSETAAEMEERGASGDVAALSELLPQLQDQYDEARSELEHILRGLDS